MPEGKTVKNRLHLDVNPTDGEQDSVDLSVEIPQIRTLAWRAAGIAALWMAVMAGGFIGLDQLSQSSQRLLDTGTKATGTVYGSSLRKGGSIEVYYPVGSIMVTAHIELSSRRSFSQGAKRATRTSARSSTTGSAARRSPTDADLFPGSLRS